MTTIETTAIGPTAERLAVGLLDNLVLRRCAWVAQRKPALQTSRSRSPSRSDDRPVHLGSAPGVLQPVQVYISCASRTPADPALPRGGPARARRRRRRTRTPLPLTPPSRPVRSPRRRPALLPTLD